MKEPQRHGIHPCFHLLSVLFLLFVLGVGTPAHATADTSTSTSTGTGTGGMFDSITVGSDGSLTVSGGSGSTTTATKESVSLKAKDLALWISGLISVLMIMCLLIQISKLGTAGDNEMARRKAIMGIMTSGVALALFGSSTIVVGFFWDLLNAP